VVEDYRTIQMSLRAHPLSFLLGNLRRQAVVKCADLALIRDGRRVEVAGVILVRQKPGSAKGVLFIAIEDETGVANGILWPDRFEAQRRTVLSSAMVSLRDRLQKEGLVPHVIIDRVVDRTDMLRGIGGLDFPHTPGPGDGATHGGGPDPLKLRWPTPRSDYHPPFNGGANPGDVIRVRSHDFH
jgi:error-prone DNA polymerase